MKPVWLHGDARAELDDAIAFYESRACGLWLDLQKKVEDVVKRIQQSPEAWTPHKRSGCRKCFTQRFPFTVYYMEFPEIIWVVAIAHGSRRPDYWRSRRPELGI